MSHERAGLDGACDVLVGRCEPMPSVTFQLSYRIKGPELRSIALTVIRVF